MLTAIRFSHCKVRVSKGGNKAYIDYWVFRCDCGNEKVIDLPSVKHGRTISCMCRRKKGLSPIENSIFLRYVGNAKRRNIKFELTKEDVLSLIYLPCVYCGCVAGNCAESVYRDGREIRYNGIDRVNNDLGYVAGNVVPCCFKCNRAKDTMTYDEFIALCKAIADRHAA